MSDKKDQMQELIKQANACKVGNLLLEIQSYTPKYSFNFQFWGEGNMNVYIEKGGVPLQDFGGLDTVEELLTETIEYLKRIKATKS
jgi:hypothetical protein